MEHDGISINETSGETIDKRPSRKLLAFTPFFHSIMELNIATKNVSKCIFEALLEQFCGKWDGNNGTEYVADCFENHAVRNHY